ncbi:MAG TPA: polysaccharide deacetylase family protein [Longimicrobiaceae bacterium]|nr:polysaccharide deacetylase family protein [Longimicrobiaceae bacterium]
MHPATRFASAGLVLAFFACGRDVEPRPAAESQAPRSGASAAPAPQQRPERTIAFTFDDLPMSRDGAYGPERMREVTARMLDQLCGAGIVAVGFVNEDKLGRGDPAARTALLERWLDAGMELGNHTYGHVSFWSTPLEEYQRQVLRGERATRRLLAERGQRPRYFRHPYLNTGPDLPSKEAFERFLAEHGYQVAPVTVDNLDVTYALAYDNAYARGDSALMRRIGGAYLEHMRESVVFSEELSRRLLDREPAQVLLLHANALNADYLDELVAMLRERGYGFVPLDRALADPAYALPDRYTGRRGLSWLQRWAITRGEEPGREPREAEWVRRVAYP